MTPTDLGAYMAHLGAAARAAATAMAAASTAAKDAALRTLAARLRDRGADIPALAHHAARRVRHAAYRLV